MYIITAKKLQEKNYKLNGKIYKGGTTEEGTKKGEGRHAHQKDRGQAHSRRKIKVNETIHRDTLRTRKANSLTQSLVTSPWTNQPGGETSCKKASLKTKYCHGLQVSQKDSSRLLRVAVRSSMSPSSLLLENQKN